MQLLVYFRYIQDPLEREISSLEEMEKLIENVGKHRLEKIVLSNFEPVTVYVEGEEKELEPDF